MMTAPVRGEGATIREINGRSHNPARRPLVWSGLVSERDERDEETRRERRGPANSDFFWGKPGEGGNVCARIGWLQLCAALGGKDLRC